MNLPVSNPPLGWKTREKTGVVTIEKRTGIAVTNDHLIGSVVVGCCPIVFILATRLLTTRQTVGEILLSGETLWWILIAPVFPAMMLIAKHWAGHLERFHLSNDKLVRTQVDFGQSKTVEVPRDRVRALTRYVPEDLDGAKLEGASLTISWRAARGEDQHLYLGLFPGRAEGEWFTRLFEAWTGRRAQLGVYDDGDEEDEGDGEEFFGEEDPSAVCR